MKRLLSLFCAISLMRIVSAQTNPNNQFAIIGTVRGIDSGRVTMYAADFETPLDSTKLSNGSFSFKGKISELERRRFAINPGNWTFRGFVDEGLITFRVDTIGARHYSSLSWIFDVDESGTEIGEAYSRFFIDVAQSRFAKLLSDPSVRQSAAKTDSLKNILIFTARKWIDSYIKKNPSSIAGPYIFSEVFSMMPHQPLGYLNETLAEFTGAAKTSAYYFDLVNMAKGLAGRQEEKVLSDFTLSQQDSSPFTLSSLRGKYILIDFWASWCVPCRKAIPYWKRVYAKYKPGGLEMLSVSNDRHREDWIKALEKEQMPWIQVVDEFPSEKDKAYVSELFKIPSLPFYILIDKDGKIIASSADEEAITQKLKQVFKR